MSTITITQSDANPGMYQFRLDYRNEHTHAHSVTLENADLEFINKLTGNSFEHLGRIKILPRCDQIECDCCGKLYDKAHIATITMGALCIFCEDHIQQMKNDAIGEY